MVSGIQPYGGSSSTSSTSVHDASFASKVSQNCGGSSGGVTQILNQIKNELSNLTKLVEQLCAKLGGSQPGGVHTCDASGGSSQSGFSSEQSQVISGLRDQLGSLSKQLDAVCNGANQGGYGGGYVVPNRRNDEDCRPAPAPHPRPVPQDCVVPPKPDIDCKPISLPYIKPIDCNPKPQPKPIDCNPKPHPKPIDCDPKPQPKPPIDCTPKPPKPEPKPIDCDPKPQPKPCGKDEKWTVSEVKDGKAEIKLGKDYTVTLDEKMAEFVIKNNCTGDTTRVWGDPHVDVKNDGKNDWDFKKDTTFQLKDGTKITVDTVDGNGKQVDKDTKGESYSSKLTITKGDKAVVVTGLAAHRDGKDNVKVTTSGNGKKLDRATDDGTVVKETKGGWQKDGKIVDQKAINDAEKDKQTARA